MNLRQRVEHGAGRLVELNRAAHFERAREDLLGALEVAELHEDLSERGERDGEAVARAERLVQRDAALGQRQRLIVTMAHQRDVRLVVHDAGEHVVGLDRHRQPLALAQRRRSASSTRPDCASSTAESECTSARWRRSPAACSADAASVRCSRTMPESPTCL